MPLNPKPASKQLVLYGQIRQNQNRTEYMLVEFDMGPMHFVVIANIPEEGKSRARAYVKLELKDESLDPQWSAVNE